MEPSTRHKPLSVGAGALPGAASMALSWWPASQHLDRDPVPTPARWPHLDQAQALERWSWCAARRCQHGRELVRCPALPAWPVIVTRHKLGRPFNLRLPGAPRLRYLSPYPQKSYIRGKGGACMRVFYWILFILAALVFVLVAHDSLPILLLIFAALVVVRVFWKWIGWFVIFSLFS